MDSIHREVKQRFFLQIPEVLRIRIDVRHLVGQIRGEQYVRLQTMRGEDFALEGYFFWELIFYFFGNYFFILGSAFAFASAAFASSCFCCFCFCCFCFCFCFCFCCFCFCFCFCCFSFCFCFCCFCFLLLLLLLLSAHVLLSYQNNPFLIYVFPMQKCIYIIMYCDGPELRTSFGKRQKQDSKCIF